MQKNEGNTDNVPAESEQPLWLSVHRCQRLAAMHREAMETARETVTEEYMARFYLMSLFLNLYAEAEDAGFALFPSRDTLQSSSASIQSMATILGKPADSNTVLYRIRTLLEEDRKRLTPGD